MVLVLLIGDLHVPHRAADIPEAFKKLLVPGRIHTVLLTGNVTCKEMYEYFRTLCSNVLAAQGDFDDYAKDIPPAQVVDVEGLKFGVIHGHQVVPWGDKEALGMWQRQLGVDVLVYGHTHQSKTFEFGGSYFINPGSVTGAFSPFESEVQPSFVLADVQGTSMTLFIYQMEGNELKVKKKEWTKR